MRPALLALPLAVALAACAPPRVGLPPAAVAVLHPTQGHEAHGTVRFETDADGGLHVVTDAAGLSPGAHAYHVHVWGDCSAEDATSAGTHFNFLGESLDPPDDIQRITGNLGELRVGRDGTAHHEATIETATLTGPKSILGRAVVIHARGNDPDSPPIGAAGARVACGVIGLAESTRTDVAQAGDSS